MGTAPLLNQMALDYIRAPRTVAYVTATEAAATRTDLPVILFSTCTLRERYRRAAADLRVRDLVRRQIRMMCHDDLHGRLGHARWLAREVAAVKAVRDAQ